MFLRIVQYHPLQYLKKIPFHNRHLSTLLLQYQNLSNQPFDGLDHNYTPEEYLQHIEARVTFSLGLQPTSENEYKYWHARRMAFIQCSLTGTAVSWYIRLNETY